MHATRRTFLALAGATAALPALAAVPPRSAPRTLRVPAAASPGFRRAFDAYVACAEAELAAWTFPAMTLALRSAAGETATATVGYANIDSRAPATPDQLFQIGSISKSFTAVALLRLADRGVINLDRPILEFAPDLPVEDARVTAAHILNHAAGFPGNTPPFAPPPAERLWSATVPGERFSYSNAGYDLFGPLIERLTAMPFDRALRTLVLDPLGMMATEPVVRGAHRGRYPRSYGPGRPGIAWFPGDPLAEAAFVEVDRAAGSIAATPADMAKYLGFVAACAAGKPQPLLSPASARRFTTAVIDSPDFGERARYGMGLATIDLEGEPALHHTGGMVSFTAAMTVDPALGCGAFANVNVGYTLNYRPRLVAWYGVALMRALGRGTALPAPPQLRAVPPVENPQLYAGRWLGPDGLELALAAKGADALALSVNGQPARLRPAGPRRFESDHPRLAGRILEFEGEAPFARAWAGGALLGRYAAPEQPRVPARLVALAGRYRSDNPWVQPGVTVVARGETLAIEGAGPLSEDPRGFFVPTGPGAETERVWFTDMLGGRAQTLNLSGERLVRTPI